jgi:catechol 2,3-dioxygenase-like lactoylglutathione lyase family enzyme
VYLSSGHDNLALHRGPVPAGQGQRLDHIGFVLRDIADVDPWHVFLRDNGARIVAAPRTHRDGARSFYCLDPAGNRVQIIFHPPLAGALRPPR